MGRNLGTEEAETGEFLELNQWAQGSLRDPHTK